MDSTDMQYSDMQSADSPPSDVQSSSDVQPSTNVQSFSHGQSSAMQSVDMQSTANTQSSTMQPMANMQSYIMQPMADTQYSTMQSSTMQSTAMQSAAMEFSAVPTDMQSTSMQSPAMQSYTMQPAAIMQSSAMQSAANMHSYTMQSTNMQSAAMKSFDMQFTNMQSSNMQSSATESTDMQSTAMPSTTASDHNVPHAQHDLKFVALANDKIIPGHVYAKREKEVSIIAKDRMKYILKDIQLLTTELPDGIFVRYAEDRPDYMKIMITGTQGTPYAGGLFEFDLYCPADYPMNPPKMTFRTTGGSSFSFNPNLYRDGYVCLSVIGTWGESSWVSNQGTIVNVLRILQACVLIEDPYCNEPGYEGHKGSMTSRLYNRKLHGNTVKLAMLDWLEGKEYGLPQPHSGSKMYGNLEDNPEMREDGIWDQVVKKHFMANGETILETIKEWMEDRAPEEKEPEQKRNSQAPPNSLGLSPNFPLPPGYAVAAPPIQNTPSQGDALGVILDENLREFAGELKKAVVALNDAERIGLRGGSGGMFLGEAEEDDEDEDEDDGELEEEIDDEGM